VAQNTIRAFVEKVILEGTHGPYAVARATDNSTITFSLSPNTGVWQEKDMPKPGTEVVLRDVVKKRGGWRAQLAQFSRLSD
jgi:hypothetical protein